MCYPQRRDGMTVESKSGNLSLLSGTHILVHTRIQRRELSEVSDVSIGHLSEVCASAGGRDRDELAFMPRYQIDLDT